MAETKKVTQEELARNDGKDGRPAWVAYKGKVYDVTESTFWMEGEHMGMHNAGRDLTEDLDMAPHSDDKFSEVKLIGDLV
ncbi:MAG: cytochrome b5 domain-containing protein [Candidatus Bathyarchaeia archaeon]